MAEVITLAEQIAEVDRELKLRSRVYPRWVEAEKITPPAAARQLARMQAVRATLVSLKAEQEGGVDGKSVSGGGAVPGVSDPHAAGQG